MLKGYLLTVYARGPSGKLVAVCNEEIPRKRDAKRKALRMVKQCPEHTERNAIVDCRKTGHTVYDVSGNKTIQTVMVDDSL